MPIVGTAGHVDHGKSSLVLALTGHNPDRLLEEQQRGMTLDLGFAPLRYAGDREAGIIDVPGHERFLHNMLAGAAGMELLLLVVAANEGPKPQTIEHLQILTFLNVQRAIIVLTKIDLADQTQQAAVEAAVRAAVSGTVAADAPIVGVSTVTGQGLDALRSAIDAALDALPQRRVQAPPFLPVDRVFALPGHGTVITGTLMQGSIRLGDTLMLQPSGVPARVKSVHTFGKKIELAQPGMRVALNVPAVDVAQISRGETLVASRHFQPQAEFSIEFSPLAQSLPLLRRRTAIRAHVGSAEIPGSLRFADGPPRSAQPIAATLVLSRPAVTYPGMRIVVRRLSPKELLGGATVVVAHAENPETAGEDFSSAPEGSAELHLVLRASGAAPLALAELARRANLLVEQAAGAAVWLVEHGFAYELHRPDEFIDARSADGLWQRLEPLLRREHETMPWRAGVSAHDIAAQLHLSETLTARLLALWAEDGKLSGRLGRWRLPDFTPRLNKAQQTFFERGLAVDRTQPFLPHDADALTAAMNGSTQLAEALESLQLAGVVVRIGDQLYRRSQIEGAKAVIARALAEGKSATMAELRDVLGTSRKYALPLMEYFDSTGFTIRDGERRRLRTRQA